MTQWREEDHPRDDEGKFTYKNGGVSNRESYEDKMQRRADILYTTMDDYVNGKEKGISTNLGLEKYLKNETSDIVFPKKYNRNEKTLSDHILYKGYELAVDHINNKEIRKIAIENYGIEAAENLYMSKTDSYLNTEYAKQCYVVDSYKKFDSETNHYFENKLIEQLELKDTPKEIRDKKLAKIKGIFINSESDSSKSLAKVLLTHPDFIKFKQNSEKKLKNNISVNGSIRFTDKNWRNALGYADIRNMRYNRYGDLELLVTDVYDFNKNETNPLVQIGRDRQLKGQITPYCIMYHVKIPKIYLK